VALPVVAEPHVEALEPEVRSLERRLELRTVIGERRPRGVVARVDARMDGVGSHRDADLERTEPVVGQLEADRPALAHCGVQVVEAGQWLEVADGR